MEVRSETNHPLPSMRFSWTIFLFWKFGFDKSVQSKAALTFPHVSSHILPQFLTADIGPCYYPITTPYLNSKLNSNTDLVFQFIYIAPNHNCVASRWFILLRKNPTVFRKKRQQSNNSPLTWRKFQEPSSGRSSQLLWLAGGTETMRK